MTRRQITNLAAHPLTTTINEQHARPGRRQARSAALSVWAVLRGTRSGACTG
jgi:hypothetical protein